MSKIWAGQSLNHPVKATHIRRRLANPLLCFTIGGLAMYIAVSMVWMIGDLIWVDFIHHNPNRSQSHALQLMALSPFYGLAVTVFSSELPLLVGAVIATAAYWIWGRVPILTLGIMLPLCVYAMHVQGQFLFPGDQVDFDYWQFLWLSKQQLPVLVGCLWCSNRARIGAGQVE
jgi:hypothetical protein